MKKDSEGIIQSKIMKNLDGFGRFVTAWKNQKTSVNSIPDIYFTSCLTGSCLIELKKEGEDVKGGQLKKLEKLNKTGTKAFAVIGYGGYIKLKNKLGLNLKNLKKAHNEFNIDNEIKKEDFYFE